MMNFTQTLMPPDKAEWGRAMLMEYHEIDNPNEKLRFALGYLQVSAISAARTRKGLSFIGRGLVAAALLSFSIGAFILTRGWDMPQAETLFVYLCFFYASTAALAISNLTGMRRLAGTGVIAAGLSWVFIKTTQFSAEGLSYDFLQALSFEAAAISGAIFIMAIYLSLINPKDEEAL